MTGTVNWFDNSKGYGFIKSDEGQDLFAHYSQIQKDGFKSLDEGDRVEFTIENDAKGDQATYIEVI